MTDEELMTYLRRAAVSYSHPLWKAADRIEALTTRIRLVEASARLRAAQASDCIEAADAERDEALNQLDSARHSVDVLEKRVAKMEAERDAAVVELRDLVSCVEDGCYCSEERMAASITLACATIAKIEEGKL
jgi:hypothetical protein